MCTQHAVSTKSSLPALLNVNASRAYRAFRRKQHSNARPSTAHAHGADTAGEGPRVTNLSYAYVRLPKTGSSSFRRDLVAWDAAQPSPALASDSSFYYEIASLEYLEGALRSGEQVVLLLREPAAMVVSMFKHCATKRFEGRAKLRQTTAPEMMPLARWLRGWHFVASGERATLADVQPLLDACSFIPVNPAAACLSSESCSPGHNLDLWYSRDIKGRPKKRGVQLDARWHSPARFDVAADVVRRARAVGVTEHYAVSLCVALQTMHAQPIVQCDCARGPPTVTVIDHNTSSVPPSLLALQENERALLDNLTSDDRALYAMAFKRLAKAAEKAELRWGRPLLGCANFSNKHVAARHLPHGRH